MISRIAGYCLVNFWSSSIHHVFQQANRCANLIDKAAFNNQAGLIISLSFISCFSILWRCCRGAFPQTYYFLSYANSFSIPKTNWYTNPHLSFNYFLLFLGLESGEWWKKDVMEVITEALATGGDPNISDAFTINGQPGDLYPCSKPG